MIETIGKIKIDDKHYPGEDLYCDGVIEDEILTIVKEHGPEEFDRIIQERKNWPVLYHLSKLRENIISWIPMKKDAKVLEVGSGCGAITGALSRKAGEVTCVELSRKRSLINAYRHLDCDNVTIRLGNFQDIEPELDQDYDYIFLIGVFEYGKSYIGGESPFITFMETMKKHLAKGGRLILAIENRLGMKYWAGCVEDHSGRFFDGIMGYPQGSPAITFSRGALEKICKASEISDYSFYYPYPDYKFMTAIYSDERLPGMGELSDNRRNFDQDRLQLFDEKSAFDSLIQDGLFREFSNSFLMVIGDPIPVKYVKYSNDRRKEYEIRTELVFDPMPEIRKYPMTEDAREHVDRIFEISKKLEIAFEGSGLKVNRCRRIEQGVALEYLEGSTLDELLDQRLHRQDRDGFMVLYHKYCDMVRKVSGKGICDYDLIFSNILVTKEGWNVIDYEWTVEEDVDPEDIIKRSLLVYNYGSEKRRQFVIKLMEQEFGIPMDDWGDILRKEIAFQKNAVGERIPMNEIRNRIGKKIIPVDELIHFYLQMAAGNQIKVYLDQGEGFSEDNAFIYREGFAEGHKQYLDLELEGGLCGVRIDPAIESCVVCMESLRVNGESLPLEDPRVIINGIRLDRGMYLFGTDDPNLTILPKEGQEKLEELPEGGIQIQLQLEIKKLPQSIAQTMEGKLMDAELAKKAADAGKKSVIGKWLKR